MSPPLQVVYVLRHLDFDGHQEQWLSQVAFPDYYPYRVLELGKNLLYTRQKEKDALHGRRTQKFR